jgi:hypothetical protein
MILGAKSGGSGCRVSANPNTTDGKRGAEQQEEQCLKKEPFYPCTRESVAGVAQRTEPAPTDDYGGGTQHLPPAIDPPAK